MKERIGPSIRPIRSMPSAIAWKPAALPRLTSAVCSDRGSAPPTCSPANAASRCRWHGSFIANGAFRPRRSFAPLKRGKVVLVARQRQNDKAGIAQGLSLPRLLDQALSGGAGLGSDLGAGQHAGDLLAAAR